MSGLTTWMSPETMRLIGISLLHFLWQGAALVALASLVMAIAKSAAARYWTGVVTLVLMVAAPVLTFVALQYTHTSEPQATFSVATWNAIQKPATTVAGQSDPVAPLGLPANSLPWIVEAWFAGVILFSMRTLGGMLLIERLRRRASVSVSETLLANCLALQKKLGIARVIGYCQSLRVEAPVVIGWLRPVVLLPVSVLTGLTDEQLEAVIAHELAHIKRLDAFVNLFQVAAETLLFYHPAAWWMSARVRAEREHCCDDAAIELCGDAVAYARALAMMEERRSAPALALAANASPLAARIRRMLGVAELRSGMRRAGLAAGFLCLSAAILAGNTLFGFVRAASAIHAQSQEQTQQQQSERTSTKARAQGPQMVVVATRLNPAPVPAQEQDKQQQAQQNTTSQTSGSGSFIDGMKAVGFDNLSVDELISLKVQGVTPDYIKAIRAEGLKPNVDELISMKVQGVTPEYIRKMRATGIKFDTVDDIVSAKVQGVSDEYIQEMRATGMKLDSADDVVSMKVQGVTADYVKQMRALGLPGDADSIVSMKVQGVTAAYVDSIRALQLKVDGDDIISMKVQGVTPEYVRSIQSLGFKPNSDEIVEMRVQGVTAEFIKALQAAGFKPDIDEVVEARVQGVSPEFIEKVKSHGFKNLTLQKIIELKQAGVLD
ncbi:MAG TPA: M56 family metallopeptidase [Candidatus Acidoferrales bacterium]|nr:M56 family metallopeptidase [Candidatus Acidoferrales bacterium]